jgi:hypothetical protein
VLHSSRTKRFSFDRKAAIKFAWDFLWAGNLKARKKNGYGHSATFYLTASDVEAQVRQFAIETAAGESWGTRGRTYGKPLSWPTIKMPGNLLHDVRDWLRNEQYAGRLTAHNFGKGHISGARYRPVGEPISEAEQTTIKIKAARKDKPRLHHFGKSYGARPMCTIKPGKTYWRSSKAWVTKKSEDVTCPRCLKLIALTKEVINA